MMTLQERVHGFPPPASWQLGKLHRVFRARKGAKNAGMQEDNLLSLSYGRIIQKDIDAAEGLLPESFETYQIVERGNIILRLTDLQNDKRSLRQGLATQRGIITSAYDALEVSKDHEPRFWAYALLALDLAKYYYSLGGGVRQSIKFADFPNEWIAVPKPRTQGAIADFLDRETVRIDQLIDKKDRQYLALEEDHDAFVTKAVTRGLDLVPMSRTGNTWLKEIPEHWELSRLKFVCARIVDCLHETPEHSDSGDYPSIRTADLVRGRLLLDQAKRVSEDEYRTRIQRLEPAEDDILYTREGERFGLAAPVPPGVKLCLGQRMMMFRTNRRVLPAFLMWSLNGQFSYNWLKQSISGATSPHLNIYDIRNVPLPLPPLAEQQSIVKRIDMRFRRKEAASEAIRKSIERLRERRSALITAAVTGQIDVTTRGKRSEIERTLDRIEENEEKMRA